MVTFVSTDWVAERLHEPGVCLIDPRRPMKHMQGHLENAVNLPLYRCQDDGGMLLPTDELAASIGAAGLDDARTPILYDSPDGRNAAMLAWILEYLGRTDVHVMDVFYERWAEEGRPILYRPVEVEACEFSVRLTPSVRATVEEVSAATGSRLVDLRSAEEYRGEFDGDDKPGHLPGAVSIPWTELGSGGSELLSEPIRLKELLQAHGISAEDEIIAYCRSGPRAAIGYQALRRYGYSVRLFDASYVEWTRRDLPVEI